MRSAAAIVAENHAVWVFRLAFHTITGLLRRTKGPTGTSISHTRRPACVVHARRTGGDEPCCFSTGVPGFCEAIMTSHFSVRSDTTICHATKRFGSEGGRMVHVLRE